MAYRVCTVLMGSLLTVLAGTARASVVETTVFLSNPELVVTSLNGSAVLTLYGEFHIPKFAADTVINSVRTGVTADMGGAAWTSTSVAWMEGQASAAYAMSTWQPHNNQFFYSAAAGAARGEPVSSVGEASALRNYIVPSSHAPAGSQFIAQEGTPDYATLYVTLNAGAYGHYASPGSPSWTYGPASSFAYIANISLSVSFDIADSSNAALSKPSAVATSAQSSSQGAVYYYFSGTSASDPMPTELRARFPSYLPIATAVPEPSTWLMTLFGLASLSGLVWRQRRSQALALGQHGR